MSEKARLRGGPMDGVFITVYPPGVEWVTRTSRDALTVDHYRRTAEREEGAVVYRLDDAECERIRVE